jgi:ankyrin repeat protein
MQALVGLGANVNARDSLGRTALHYAVYPPHHILRALYGTFDSSLPLEAENHVENWLPALSPFLPNQFRACKIVDYLLLHGADAVGIDELGWMPSHYAALSCFTMCLQALDAALPASSFPVPAVASTNIFGQGHNGITPLHISYLMADERSINWMLERGCDPLATDVFGVPPFSYQALLRFEQ